MTRRYSKRNGLKEINIQAVPDDTKSDEDKEKFREANKTSRKAVRIAKAAAYEDLYAKLDSREGVNMVYKLAKTRDMRSKDISDMPFNNSWEGKILTVGSEIILRWLTYFNGLLNTENPRKQIENDMEYIVRGSKYQNDSNFKLTLEQVFRKECDVLICFYRSWSLIGCFEKLATR